MSGRNEFLKVVGGLPFEAHNIGHELDATGRYALKFDGDFPLRIRLFEYRSGKFTQGVTWHEQLELFFPIDGAVDLQMGKQVVSLRAGDLLVVDNLKLHHVIDRPGLKTRVVVVSFLPKLICQGPLSCDFEFLVPFFTQSDSEAYVLRNSEPSCRQAQLHLAELIKEYFVVSNEIHRQAACKCALLNLLLLLLRRFQNAPIVLWEFERRRQLGQQFRKLLNELHAETPTKPSLGEAARMCSMSPASFTRSFRQMAGMSYLEYITHLRLTEAARLLRSGALSIAEIAEATGFADQSHFDRRFKRAYGMTPRRFRQGSKG